ncbi:L-Aspartase-like protein [Aspergillus oleicola]
MNTATIQTYLRTTIQVWARFQCLIRDGNVGIDGTKLDIPRVVAVACNDCIPKITEDTKIPEKVDVSIRILKERLERGYGVYGVNTGLCWILLTSDKTEDENTTLASYSMPASWVRGTIIARCNSNLAGILQLISASGNLMLLSYFAGTNEGNPDVHFRVQSPEDARGMKSNEALQTIGVGAQKLVPKEGLGLMNGTSTSAAVASLILYEANQLAVLVQALSAMGLEALMGTVESFHPLISAVRPHDGQLECADNLLTMLHGPKLAQGLEGQRDQDRPGLIRDRYLCAAASVTSAMGKTRLPLKLFGRLNFSQATEMIDPSLNNGLPTNLVADDLSLSFTMKGVDISLASYMSELGYLANPELALSAQYSMQAVEIVSLMCACDLYITRQALDLCALHLTFLEHVKAQLQTVTSSVSSNYLSEAALADLSESLNQHLIQSWPVTIRLSPHDQVNTVIDYALPVLLGTNTGNSWIRELGLRNINEWKIQACNSLKTTYQETADAYFLKQHTADLLGEGSKILYRTIRQELGVPFH